MPGLCRYDALASMLAHLDGVVLTEPLAPCSEPQEHETAVVRDDGDGHTVALYTNVCHSHDVVISLAHGYKASRRLRTSTA